MSRFIKRLLVIGCVVFALQGELVVMAEETNMETVKQEVTEVSECEAVEGRDSQTEMLGIEIGVTGEAIVSTEYPDYSYHMISDTQIQLYEYTGEETVVVIPETMDGFVVAALGPVFYENTTVTEVTIPKTVLRTQSTFYLASALETVHLQEGIEEIGEYTFYECTNLKSVNLPEGLISIQWSAFYNCRSLAQIEFPSTLQHFGNYNVENVWSDEDGVFYNCDSLKSVVIPKSVTDFFGAMTDDELWYYNGQNIFFGCDNLTEIIFEDENLTTIPTGMYAGLSQLQTYTVPNTVTRIGNGAFSRCKNLTSITIPDSVKWIGDGAFFGCSKMQKIVIPDSVTFMGIYVFNNCIKLSDVTLSKALTGIPEYTFLCCESLERIVIPAKVERIYRYAFSECTSLTEVVWPDNLLSIANGAFDCTALSSVDIPDTVTHLLDGAFGNCWNLEEVNLPDNLEYMGQGCFHSIKGLETLEIPNTLTSCEEGALFYADIETLYFEEGTTKILAGICGNGYVKKVVLPDSVTVIEEIAFYNCPYLKEISGTENVIRIENRAFEECNSLQKINLPKVQYIGEGAFSDANALKYVDLTKNTELLTIGAGAFYDCTNLKAFYMPDSVTSLGMGIFEECTNLKSIHLSKNLSEIPEKAFSKCKVLEEVALGELVLSVGDKAFADCVKLERLLISNDFCDIASQGLYNVPAVTIYGSADSSVQSFADNNGIPFEEWVPATSLNVLTPTVTVETGREVAPDSSVLPNNTNDTVRYCSFDESIATADGENNLTGISVGSTKILVTAGLEYGFCECSVTEKTIEITPSEVQLRVGESVNLTVEAKGAVTLSCADEKIATVSADGTVTAVSEGKTVITATDTNGNKDYCTVWVVGDVAIPVASEDDFTYTLLEDGTASITGYNGSLTTFEIPDTLDGYSVSSIGEKAFYKKTGIVRVVFPSTITQIGKSAFEGCTGMTELKLPIYIEFMDTRAFMNCDGITEIMVPKTLEFYRTSTMAVFQNCDNLKKVTFEDGTLAVQGRLTEECPKLEQVIFPDSVVSIGGAVFVDCDAITELELPPHLIGIGSRAFADCDGLTSIHIPKSLDYCGTPRDEQGDMMMSQLYWVNVMGAFAECDNLKTVTFEAGITKIPTVLFEQCTGLEEITIPDTVSVIEAAAFAHCTNLKKVNMPDTVTYIQDCAFASTALESIDLPSNLYELDLDAFLKCSNLTEVTVPKSLKKCYKAVDIYPGITLEFQNFCGAFKECDSLKKVIWEDGSTVVCDYIFSGCTSIEEVIIPDTVVTIGIAPISGANIKSIDLPDNLISIGESAFEDTSLESIVIPDTVTKMGDYCFKQCSQLSDVVLPKGITTIPASAFRYCTSLKKIEIPDSVVEICDYAFADTGFVEFDVPEGIESVQGAVFAHCENLVRVSIPDSVTNFGGAVCFTDCVNLKEVTFGDGVTYIPDAAFSGCTSLERIVLPKNLVSIGDRVFENCTALKEVVMPEGMQMIGGQAFQGCTALTEMVLPRGMTEIQYWAFHECSNFKKITIPSSVYAIDAAAFDNPEAITICGVAGSYAETYANQVNATFVPILVPATSVSLNVENLDMFVGDWEYLTATILPADCTDSVSWESSDSLVVTVSDTGVITACGPGVATVYVKVGDLQASCTVTVKQAVSGVSLDVTEATLTAVGETVQLTATVEPDNADNKSVVWTSLNPEIATVSGSGLVTAVAHGTATIMVQTIDGGKIAICTINVDIPIITEPIDPVASFVERMYVFVLGRESEEGGKAVWTAALKSGSKDGAGLAKEFVLGAEFEARHVSNSEFVHILYITFLDRGADEGGLAAWSGALDAGMAREAVLAGFVNSAEFTIVCSDYGIQRGLMFENGDAASPGITAFVNRFYQLIMGRDADEEGLKNWVFQLIVKAETPTSIGKFFFTSTEYMSKNADNEKYVTDLYNTFFGRAPDEEGLNLWVAQLELNLQTREEILEFFATSDEFALISQDYGL